MIKDEKVVKLILLALSFLSCTYPIGGVPKPTIKLNQNKGSEEEEKIFLRGRWESWTGKVGRSGRFGRSSGDGREE